MSQLISKPLNGTPHLVKDDYLCVQLEQDVPTEGKVLVHLDVWQAEKDALKSRAEKGELGVWLNPDDDPEALAADLGALKIIGFHFPIFKFGQAYSSAVLLRNRHGFKGEIFAFGDLWRDQMYPLSRCGFTLFRLKEGKSLHDAMKGFSDFTTPYQASADDALPIFTRRLA